MKLVQFVTETCSKCAVVSHFLKQQGAKFDVIDAVKQKELAKKFQILSVPTTILLADDQTELVRSSGVNPTELLKIIHKFQIGEMRNV
ncbi:thioredoxin domain-containing protein [Bacillus niameyensis]|uniref:thioredoxin domain-containing protein n=1 Tax=Bacillus niameyensis TaxID=1522308 RepID=UPI00078220F9|nr:thioredoxin domain-containing protein [Bacillus niameyensis]